MGANGIHLPLQLPQSLKHLRFRTSENADVRRQPGRMVFPSWSKHHLHLSLKCRHPLPQFSDFLILLCFSAHA